MTRHCSVKDCMSSSRLNPDLKFFCFPTQEETCLAWIKFCGEDYLIENWKVIVGKRNSRHRICSLHFRRENFMNEKMDKLCRGVVPSLNGPPDIMECTTNYPTGFPSGHSVCPTPDSISPPHHSPLPWNNLPIHIPCTSSTSTSLRSGPSHTPSLSSTVQNLSIASHCPSFNVDVSPSPRSMGVSSISNALVYANDTVGAQNPDAESKYFYRKEGISLPHKSISWDSFCVPCKKMLRQYRKEKNTEIKRLRETVQRLKRCLQSMHKKLTKQLMKEAGASPVS